MYKSYQNHICALPQKKYGALSSCTFTSVCVFVCVAYHKHTYICTHKTSITSGQLNHIYSKLTPPFHMHIDLGDIHTYTQAHTHKHTHTSSHTQAHTHKHTHKHKHNTSLDDKKLSGIVVNYGMCKCRRG